MKTLPTWGVLGRGIEMRGERWRGRILLEGGGKGGTSRSLFRLGHVLEAEVGGVWG